MPLNAAITHEDAVARVRKIFADVYTVDSAGADRLFREHGLPGLGDRVAEIGKDASPAIMERRLDAQRTVLVHILTIRTSSAPGSLNTAPPYDEEIWQSTAVEVDTSSSMALRISVTVRGRDNQVYKDGQQRVLQRIAAALSRS